MSVTANVTRDDRVFLGEDKTLRFTIYSDAAQTLYQDASAFGLSWKLASKPGATAALTKTVGSGIAITGTYTSPSVSTQKVEVSIADTDTDALTPGTWYHELKRTDGGVEAVLAQGTIYFHKPVHTS